MLQTDEVNALILMMKYTILYMYTTRSTFLLQDRNT